jgi:hypothetical protein
MLCVVGYFIFMEREHAGIEKASPQTEGGDEEGRTRELA